VSPVEELVGAVDAAFVETGRGLAGWPNPHPDRLPLDEEYSRVTNPYKWQILAARADAWLAALADAGLAEIEEETNVAWEEPPRLEPNRAYRARPRAPGALPLVVAMERLEGIDDAGVSLGVGDPAVLLLATPGCGCDACDSGSQDALDEFDEYMLSVVTGSYRKLRLGKREITVISDNHRSSRGFGRYRPGIGGFMMDLSFRLRLGRFQGVEAPNSGYYVMRPRKILTHLRTDKVGVPFLWRRRRRGDQVDRILANVRGWNELSGVAWLNEEEFR